jgi:hypothetical protein
MYGNPNQNMDDKFFVQVIFVIFQKVNPRWNLSKQSSSINSRWAWFTCQPTSNTTSSTIWASMITLPSHTSHVLQTLNVSYFKPFKTTF